MLVRVLFEKWVDSAEIDPDEDDNDLVITYYRLNGRWFEVTEDWDWDGYESTVTQRDQREIDYDPSIKTTLQLGKTFVRHYEVDSKYADPIATIAQYVFWWRQTLYFGPDGSNYNRPDGVNRVKVAKKTV
jgi:hypothetical protein